MSTPQSIPHVAPRFRIGLGTVLSAFGVLAAIAVKITILALTGANHTTATTPATVSEATSFVPQVHYLGPRQEHAATKPHNGDGTSPAAGAGNPAAHYACLGAAQRCLR